MEALGSGPLPGPFFSSSILGTQILLESASDEQKQHILPQIAEGKVILTLALTEPAYSWEPRALNTVAVPEGSGYIINGLKLFIYDAKAASHFIVAAKTENNDSSSKSSSLFLVDSQTEGISIRLIPGFLSGMSFEVQFNNVYIPGSSLLGKKGEGWQYINDAVLKATPVLCSYKVGGCQAVFDIALEYTRIRIQFGQPIGRFQRVQDMIIEMANHSDAARWATYEALWKLDTKRPAKESIHLAKALSSEAYWQVCTLGHQVFSGLSYSKEHQQSFHTRTSRHLYNYLGDPSFHRRELGKIIMTA
jgi:acyl-CoA dehydrogenase